MLAIKNVNGIKDRFDRALKNAFKRVQDYYDTQSEPLDDIKGELKNDIAE